MNRLRPVARQPARRFGRAVLRVCVVIATLANGTAGLAAEPTVEPLQIAVRGPLFEGSDLVVEVRQGGALAGKRLALQLAVDGVSVGRYEASGDRTTLRAEAALSTAGSHQILVKSGSVRVATTVRVWPIWAPWLGAGFLATALLLTLARRRRQRDAPSEPSATT